MDPRLVTDFNRRIKVREVLRRALDDLVLGLPGHIGRVEIEDVEIADAPTGRVARAMVPDGLEQAARCEVAIRQAERGQPLQQRHIGWYGADTVEKAGLIEQFGFTSCPSWTSCQPRLKACQPSAVEPHALAWRLSHSRSRPARGRRGPVC